MTHRIRRRLPQRGLTLVEHVLAMAIVTGAAGLASTGLGALQHNQRLQSAAAALETDVQFARSLAVARNEFVRLQFERAQGRSCYVVYAGPAQACDCAATAAPRCSSEAQLLRHVPVDPSLSVELLSRAGSIGFDGRLGTLSPTATIELRNARQQTLRLVINLMGRVRSCSPDASVPAEPRC